MKFTREAFLEFIHKKDAPRNKIREAYYMNVFDMHSSRRWFAHWNWSAFLVPEYWMAYRGMLTYAIMALLIPLSFYASGAILRDSQIASNVLTIIGYIILPCVIKILLGCYGNALYLRFAEKKIALYSTPQNYGPSAARAVLYGFLSFFIFCFMGFLFVLTALSRS